MGTPEFATESLKLLVLKNYNIVGVVTSPDKPSGRGQKITSSSVKLFAETQNLNILQPENLRDSDFIRNLKKLNADIFIVVAFRILPEKVWKIPKYGTINLHASLLPNYRGAAPINWVIINGEKETGVSTFKIEKNIDTGNIIFQEKIKISPDEIAGNLHDKLMLTGSKLVCKTIDAITHGKAPNIPQNNKFKSYAPKIYKRDCKIDWNKNVEYIHNKIRGLSPYPTAWTLIDKSKKTNIKLFKSSVEKVKHNKKCGTVVVINKNLKIAAKNGYIKIHELQLSGKKRMKTEDFLMGFSFSKNQVLQ